MRIEMPVAALVCVLAGCGAKAPQVKGEKAVTVRVARPDRVERPYAVAASGTVEATESVEVGFQVAGKVARVLVDEGQAVRRGQALAELDAADYRFGLAAAEAQMGMAQAGLDKARAGARAEELEQARAGFARAEDEYKRYKQLYERKSLAPVDWAKVEAGYRAAKAQLEMAQNGARVEDKAAAGAAVEASRAQAEVSRKRVRDARLVAPLDGVVARRMVDAGETVGAGMPVFSLMALDPARVRVGIPESDIDRVRRGQKARVSVPALNDEAVMGTVELVGVAADPASRTFTAKILVPNRGLRLKAGMIAEASVETSGVVRALVIPGEAVVHDAQGATLVYVYYADRKRAYARRVEALAVRDRGVEIVSGLTAEDQVVVAGQHKLREGSLVEVAQ